MIYVLIGVIVLLVMILVAMGIALWQGKDYVYTREYLNEETFSTRQECQDRINMVLKDYNDFKNERLEDNKKFMELTSLYTTRFTTHLSLILNTTQEIKLLIL